MAGKAGYLGTTMQKAVNSGWARAGKWVGSESMVKSGTLGYAQGATKAAYNNMVSVAETSANAKNALKNINSYEDFAKSDRGLKLLDINTNKFTAKLNDQAIVGNGKGGLNTISSSEYNTNVLKAMESKNPAQ